MMEMDTVIAQELDDLERVEGVRVLYACESGSRAWGYASADADYDVRFVYLHKRDWYLQLQDTRDVIDWKLDETLDISGWDLTKFLQLTRKSNPSAFEWLGSPIVYREARAFSSVREVAHRSLDLSTLVRHYLHMAQNDWEHRIGQREHVKLKDYLYVVRPLLAARWLLERHEMGPQRISDLAEVELEGDVLASVQRLLATRAATPEVEVIDRVPTLDAWAERELAWVHAQADGLRRAEPLPWEAYNRVFLDIIGE